MQFGRQFEYEVVLDSELDSQQFRIVLVRHLLVHFSSMVLSLIPKNN
jgi:hypothetical protein